MSDRAGGYTEYGFTAEFYDHVAPYQEHGNVAFFVEIAQLQAARCWRSAAAPAAC